MTESRIAGAAQSAADKIGDAAGRAGEVRSRIEGGARQAAERMRDAYDAAYDGGSEAAKAVRDNAATLEEVMRDAIETRPYVAVGVALGIGWLIGRFGAARER